MFIIQLNQLDGVEIILKALRERSQERGCLASHDLAEGIEKTLIYVDEKTGVGCLASSLAEPEMEPGPKQSEAKKSPFSVIK